MRTATNKRIKIEKLIIQKETTMKRNLFKLTVAVLVLLVFGSVAFGQSGSDIYWRIDPSVKTCSMDIDPSLTQAQWHRFTKQVGAITSFKAMGPANTLGKMKFNIAIDYGHTPVDQHDLAWINTFVHPDETCPLGDAIALPTLRARIGLSDRIDIGGLWTTAPDANYGMVGGEVKYAFLQESRKRPAAAVRLSATWLTGVPDFNMGIYSIDLLASKKFSRLAPYIGLRHSLAVGTETTSKVDLQQEIVPFTQGFVGAAYSVWAFNLAAEYDISTVNTFAFALGCNF
jgi:hypothetical protein